MKKFLSKLFNNKNQIEPDHETLDDQYNMMTAIKFEDVEKYSDQTRYKYVKDNIYEDLNDDEATKYRMTISFELESDEDQYPLEDLLDKFYLHVTDFYEAEETAGPAVFKRELAGELEDLIKAQTIIGKKVYNQDFLDGTTVKTRLIIE